MACTRKKALNIAPDEPVLTIRQAAERENVTEGLIRHYVTSGQLKAHRFGDRLIRIPLSELDKLRHPVNPYV